MFNTSKYTNIYYSIIRNAKARVKLNISEKHHIIPKSLGGSNDESNLVELTPKEHFVCHRLLVKMTSGNNRKKMAYALWSMTRKSSKHSRNLNSRQYEVAREAYVSYHPMKHMSEEQRKLHGQKISKATKGKPKKKWSEKSKKARVDAYASGKLINGNAKLWLVTHPDGTQEEIDNMSVFCKEHGLSKGNISKHGKSKGFTAIRYGHVSKLSDNLH